MKGFRLITPRVSGIMLAGRKDLGVTRQLAAEMLGFPTQQRLYQIERCYCPFPLEKIPRACELYKLELYDVVKLLVDDYTDCIVEYYGKGK